ncbi:MAG TPA: tRNA-binding protein [Chondromyces sp.]|nr:tRNA-binding protein [Chondromyces sp.]
MATFDDFLKLDIRAGQIIEAKEFPEARKPAYQLKIDLGEELGVKQSSAQITDLYSIDELIGKQVLVVANFPPMIIARFKSEVLVLGVYSEKGVVLLKPDQPVKNGDKVG